MIGITKLREIPAQLTGSQTILLTFWSLFMISLPIVDWTLGWDVMVGAINAGILAQFMAVILILVTTWGLRKTLKVTALVVSLSLVIEALGSHTGFPFGAYSYTEVLRIKFLNVPLLIPLAWMMMLPPSWAVAQVLTFSVSSFWQVPAFIVISGFAMTAWDLFLDPQMVTWGLWEWQQPSGYFGIPWSNLGGWLLASALITMVVKPRDIPVVPLLLVYTITWLLETVGLGFFWGITGPAIIGGIVMGSITILGWRAYWKDN